MKIETAGQWAALAVAIVTMLGAATAGVTFYVQVQVRSEVQALRADLRDQMNEQATMWDEQRRAMSDDFHAQVTRLVDTITTLIGD
jgi:uncharacterized protein HemX